MRILTHDLREKLLANGRQQQPLRGTDGEIDFVPVVKLFAPDAAATWLLTGIDPDDPDINFGLCDLGLSCPEIGNVSFSELAAVRGPLGFFAFGRGSRTPPSRPPPVLVSYPSDSG
ncbi:DUF2958 domain-containing protein [Mesorhizobium escarrei]|uniref:Transposase n=1 Tax=Mesorhizobium escarrei TaxID=666018 RepID=A0ABM9EDG9_9HYPH|nr:DUF2958 domain-containing protein [Mesorhizobium escarrei]CAH2407285.1 transposase [Mesorhizobium escarrei]